MDLIERQATIDAVHKNYDTILDFKSDGRTVADSFEDIINALPPAQPKGHWILVHPLQEDDTGAYMCSECKVGNWEIDPESYFFCPNCGADMRG